MPHYSRRIEDLHPETRRKAEEFLEALKKKGYAVSIVNTYRSPKVQNLFYMQGRLRDYGITWQELNRMRKEIGLPEITEKEANTIITYLKGYQSMHVWGLALDISVRNPNWKEIREIAQKCGLRGLQFEQVHYEDAELCEAIKKL